MRGHWKLTPEQQDFAAEHHDKIVFTFLRANKLYDDEYYTVVIYQYLYSVKIYLERPALHKWKFSTIANKNMRGAVYRYWQKENRLPTSSLDASVSGRTGLMLLDTCADRDTVESMVDFRELLRLWACEKKVSA